MQKITFLLLGLIASAAIFSAPVFADYQTPTFPLCTNPQGSVIANWDTGSHAIAGQMSQVDGKDTVYSLDKELNQVTQCYCPPTELNGIQTNWLQASNISEEEKQQLLNNGWVYIQNGSSWGLANAPYLAQNMSYTCNSSGRSTPSTITAVVQAASSTNTNSSSNSSSSSSSSSSNTPSSLPNTGDSVVLLEIMGVGILSILISFLLKKKAA
ncbi:MAG TPA: LPXTG cell wall anchor domain-containing protein [Candidatus Saccharimonadales bacterium]|nr:LPXTG cell wall anchor domain-containing protein [Candidatus Saccharimonadales bacterium]